MPDLARRRRAGPVRSRCGLGAIDLAAPIEAVPAAMGGAATGAATLGAAMRIGAAIQVYAGRIAEMSTAAAECAKSYRASDDASAASLDRLLPR